MLSLGLHMNRDQVQCCLHNCMPRHELRLHQVLAWKLCVKLKPHLKLALKAFHASLAGMSCPNHKPLLSTIPARTPYIWFIALGTHHA